MSAVVGIDVGGTKILGSVYASTGPGLLGDVLAQERIPTPPGAEGFVDGTCALIEKLRDGVDARVDAVGLGAPGLVDRTGTLRFGPNLPGVVDVSLRDAIGGRVGVPVVVENDATCATWAEYSTGHHGADDLVLVTLGTGIGAGWVSDGRLQVGASGFAGEAGHMVVDVNGPRCPCGRRGCWERYASGTGLGRMARDAAQAGRAARLVELAGGDPEAVRGEHVATAAREGDAEAGEIMGEFAWWVALGLANLVNLLDTGVLVIGGGLVESADLFLEPARAALHELVFAADRRPPLRVEVATVGEAAGSMGAALLATERPAQGAAGPG